MGDYERYQKSIQNLWDNFMSDEDTSVYGDVYESDSYQPSDDSSSSADSLPARRSQQNPRAGSSGYNSNKSGTKKRKKNQPREGSSSSVDNISTKRSERQEKSGPSGLEETLKKSDIHTAAVMSSKQADEVDVVSDEGEHSRGNSLENVSFFSSSLYLLQASKDAVKVVIYYFDCLLTCYKYIYGI